MRNWKVPEHMRDQLKGWLPSRGHAVVRNYGAGEKKAEIIWDFSQTAKDAGMFKLRFTDERGHTHELIFDKEEFSNWIRYA